MYSRRRREADEAGARSVDWAGWIIWKLPCVGDDGSLKDSKVTGQVFDEEIHKMRRLDYLVSLFFLCWVGGAYLGREKQEQRQRPGTGSNKHKMGRILPSPQFRLHLLASAPSIIKHVFHLYDNKCINEGKCGRHSWVFLSRARHVAGELSQRAAQLVMCLGNVEAGPT